MSTYYGAKKIVLYTRHQKTFGQYFSDFLSKLYINADQRILKFDRTYIAINNQIDHGSAAVYSFDPTGAAPVLTGIDMPPNFSQNILF